MKWRVEQEFPYGWDDAGLTLDGELEHFDSRNEAQAAIRTHVAKCQELVKLGHLDGAPAVSQFRVVPDTDEDNEREQERERDRSKRRIRADRRREREAYDC